MLSRFVFAGIIIPLFVVFGQQHPQQGALDAGVSNDQERPQVQTANRSAARYHTDVALDEASKNLDLRNDPLNIFEGTCSNGVLGVESDNGKYCCPPGCTACAGSGCGSFGTDCCSSDIVDLCSSTRTAPCEIDDEGAGGGGSASGSTCSNGFDGVESSNGQYCCTDDCSACGGKGCRGFGTTCCTSAIEETCSAKGSSPCIIDESSSPTPSAPTGSTCSNGFDGVESSNGQYCCTDDCSQCGGSGCRGFGTSCCTSAIEETCSAKGESPCIIDGPTSPTPSGSTCSNGFDGVESSNGQYCCTDDCSACGGSGCRGFGTSCCLSAIEEMCSVTGVSPCVIDNASPTPLAPSPVAPTPPAPTPSGVSPMPFTIPSPDYPMDVPSPTPIMTIPDSCTDPLPTIRYAQSSGVAGRMYMEGSGCGTMTDLYQARVESDGWTPKGPIYILDENNDIDYAPTVVTGKWLLAAELYVRSGAIFYCKGTDIGGDCDELRIQSTGSDDFHEVRGHGGSLYFENTVVTSWDTPNKQPQEDYEGGRSFLNCVSEYESDVTCEGEPKNDIGECRMDIINSEMGYMGFFDSESYGLTWKVRGFCKDTSNPEVFDNTHVYGDIKNSDIHHMYYGMYTYGHQGGVWTDNKMHDNVQYGFDPHDDSDYLTIARNEVWSNGNHGIIASKRCNNVKIYDNEVYNGGAQAAGIFLHRSTDSAEVYDNYVHDMQDAGIAILESFDSEIYNNVFVNVKYGIRISLGGGNNYVHDNTFDTCSQYGFFTYMGSDAPEKTADGRPGENYFVDNEVLSTEMGVKIKEADNTVIEGNTFTGTTELQFFDAQATIWSGNTIPSGACLDIVDEDDGEVIPLSTFAEQSGLPGSC